MKKWKIILIVLAVILAIISGLLWWQFDNIKAIYYSYRYDNNTIGNLIDKQNEEVEKYIRENSDYNVRPSTESEEKLHSVGLINDDEFINILTGETSVDKLFGTDIKIDENKNFVTSNGDTVTKEELEAAKKEDAGNSGNSSSNTDPQSPPAEEKPSASDKASKCIAQMYVLKSSFTSRLDRLFNEAKAYYISLTPEQRKTAKTELMDKYYSQVSALEYECDTKVNAILSELDAELTLTGEDKSIINKIRDAYNQEKSLKKAYYLNLVK